MQKLLISKHFGTLLYGITNGKTVAYRKKAQNLFAG